MGKTKKKPRANHGELQQRWDEMFILLQNYHAEHGDCLVPQGYDDSPNLARWVNSQRERQRNGSMPKARKAQLDTLNFWWGISNTDRWNTMYEKLIAFHAEHGHFYVPSSHEDTTFYKWVTKQKSNLRSDDLPPERKEKLVSIGFPGTKPKFQKRKSILEKIEQEGQPNKKAKRDA